MSRGRRDQQGSGLAYHFLAAVDLEGFSRLDAAQQARRHQELARVLDAAARRTGMDRSAWEREVQGDGELAVLPDGTDGPALVARYPRELANALARVNGDGGSWPRLRLRLALHHGTLAAGEFGKLGDAPTVVSRLRDSDVLRRELARRINEDLVLIVSESIYRDVVKTRWLDLDPAEFVPVPVRVKGQEYRGYIHRPLREGTVGAGTLASSPEEPPRRGDGTLLIPSRGR